MAPCRLLLSFKTFLLLILNLMVAILRHSCTKSCTLRYVIIHEPIITNKLIKISKSSNPLPLCILVRRFMHCVDYSSFHIYFEIRPLNILHCVILSRDWLNYSKFGNLYHFFLLWKILLKFWQESHWIYKRHCIKWTLKRYWVKLNPSICFLVHSSIV